VCWRVQTQARFANLERAATTLNKHRSPYCRRPVQRYVRRRHGVTCSAGERVAGARDFGPSAAPFLDWTLTHSDRQSLARAPSVGRRVVESPVSRRDVSCSRQRVHTAIVHILRAGVGLCDRHLLRKSARSWTCIQLRRCNYGDHIDCKKQRRLLLQ
jgi:hypothetical protein